MQKSLSLLAGMMLLASVAYAAAPVAPVFNTPVKVAEGKTRGSGNKVAVDGTTIYAAFEDSATGQGRVAKTTNGVTWGLSIVPDAAATSDMRPIRVAVSNDPVYPGLKIVHAVWGVFGDPTNDVKYSYYTTRPSQTGWSNPVSINGAGAAYDDIYLTVSKTTGAVHLLLGSYYTKASSPGSAFDYPFALASAGSKGSIAIDAQNNLYAAFTDGTFRKTSSGLWLPAVTFTAPGTVINDNVDLAIADANTYYITYGDSSTLNILLATSTNSGATGTWIKRNVMPFTADISTSPGIAVSSTKVLTLVAPVALSSSGVNVVKVVRTNDNGVSWSSPVIIQNDDSQPTIALDASNKAMIYGRDGQDGKDWSFIRTNPNANLLFIKEK